MTSVLLQKQRKKGNLREFINDSGRVPSMMQVPLGCDINIAINDPFLLEVANPEHPFTAMLMSRLIH